jgi:hypothetical protein
LKEAPVSSGSKILLVSIALACMIVGLLLFGDGRQEFSSDTEQMRLFQRSMGGLGMGAASTPAWNVLHYDPRLQSVDDSNLFPVPGGYPYSPSSASAAVALREIPREDLRVIGIEQ